MEATVIDGQTAIFGLREHIGETVAPQNFVGEIGSAGVDRLQQRFVEPSDSYDDFRSLRRQG
jgi:hypothetical protein